MSLNQDTPDPRDVGSHRLSSSLTSLLVTTSEISNTSFSYNTVLSLRDYEKTCKSAITAMRSRENYLYIGTSDGQLLCFSLDNPLQPRIKSSIQVANVKVDKIDIIEGVGCSYVIVLAKKKLSLHKVSTLALQHALNYEVSTFCCNSGTPFCGLAVASGNTLHLYNLAEGLTQVKTFYLPEKPLRMGWFRDFICIGYKNEYSLVNDASGRSFKLSDTKGSLPVLKTLPMEGLLISVGRFAVIVDTSGKKSSSNRLKTNSTYQFAFSFPFLFAFSKKETVIEIKSIIDPQYHEVMRPPSRISNINIICDDSRNVYVSECQTVYIIQSHDSGEVKKDYKILKTIVESFDRGTFNKYVHDVLVNSGTPFNILLKNYVDSYTSIIKKQPVESLTIETLKSHANTYTRRLYKAMSILLRPYVNKVLKEQLYLVISVVYHNCIYDDIFPILKTLRNHTPIGYRKDIRPIDCHVRKKFWLIGPNLVATPGTTSNAENLVIAGKATLYRKENGKEPHYIGVVNVFYDKDYRLFVSKHEDNVAEVVSTTELLSFNDDELSILWKDGNVSGRLAFDTVQDYREISTQFQFASNQYADLSLSPKFTFSKSTTIRRATSLGRLDLLATPYHDLDSIHSSRLRDLPKINFYKPAYHILRRLRNQKSPREKLECLIEVLDSIVKCVGSFYGNNEKIVVGADDLIPIVTYIIAKAAISELLWELDYIYEFSTEACVRGKFGYALATFQIATETYISIIKSLETQNPTQEVPLKSQVKDLIEKIDTFNIKMKNQTKLEGPYEYTKSSSDEDSDRPNEGLVIENRVYACILLECTGAESRGFISISNGLVEFTSPETNKIVHISAQKLKNLKKTWGLFGGDGFDMDITEEVLFFRKVEDRDEVYAELEALLQSKNIMSSMSLEE